MEVSTFIFFKNSSLIWIMLFSNELLFFKLVFNKQNSIIFIRKNKIFTLVFLGYFLCKVKEAFIELMNLKIKKKIYNKMPWMSEKSENGQCFIVIKYV